MTIQSQPEKLHFQAEVKQLLDIVVHSLYSNKEIFLRELISNSSDAIDKLRFLSLTDSSLYEEDPDLSIHLNFNKEDRTITVSDNGIGMDKNDVISNLGTIAKSGTREFLSKLTGDQKKDAHLIGQFGVGFYSSFIVADKVTVLTRKAGEAIDQAVCWESTGDGEYNISTIEKATRGTEVILHLKPEQDEFLDDWRLRNIITKYSNHINIPILMPKLNEEEKATNEWETVNRATALWTLPKNSITKEQYEDFYKHSLHDFAQPLAWTHHKIEGNIDYLCLLYLPSHAPFDLWQRDTHHGLKLYVQRVYIMDQVEQFLPHYLRFIRGIVDTTALPLNVSREILQDHPTIFKLRSALVRHVLDLLDKLAQDDPEKYATFWKQFGTVLKEGAAEDFANKNRIAKLFRFNTTEVADESASLDDYVKRMQPSQKKIFYIAADNINAAKSSPHLEIFLKNNIEVLLLTDKIDEWVIAHLSEFEGKPLQSIAKGDLQLDEVGAVNENPKTETEQTDFADFIKKIKAILDTSVKEVRLSHRLINSPACLVRDQNALGPQMERLLKAAGQAITEVNPILEINPDHAIIKKLQMLSDEEQLKEWTHILYEQALLTEGSPLPDPAKFVQRLNNLWMKAFN